MLACFKRSVDRISLCFVSLFGHCIVGGKRERGEKTNKKTLSATNTFAPKRGTLLVPRQKCSVAIANLD